MLKFKDNLKRFKMKLKISKKNSTKTTHHLNSGFTLLELLIVIGIIAILSVALVLVINPSEVLKKGRDSQRMSDLATLKTALGLHLTNTSSPKMAGTTNTGCKGTTSSTTWQLATDQIYYSYPSDSPGSTMSAKNLDSVTFTGTGGSFQVTKANLNLTDGNGWLPVNFSSLTGGSPISTMPVDPVNTIATPASPTTTDLVYRYVCSERDLTYEIDAVLESTAYTVTDNKMVKDGGNSDSYYEVGTDLALLTSESFTPDPCAGKNVGEAASGGAICAGTYGGSKYMTTPADAGTKQWSNVQVTTGATSTSNGSSNTATLAGLGSGYAAAYYCKNLSYGGYADWFLPAKDELNSVLYLQSNCKNGNNCTNPGGNVITGFVASYYWSSMEDSATYAWNQGFDSGDQYHGGDKTTSRYVRCVRKY